MTTNAVLALRIAELDRQNLELSSALNRASNANEALKNKIRELEQRLTAQSDSEFELMCKKVDIIRCLKTLAFEHNHADIPAMANLAKRLMQSLSEL